MSNKVGRPKFADRPVFAFEQEVEQAVARGRSDAWIIERYGCTPTQIDEVNAYLERIHHEEDSFLGDPATAPKLPLRELLPCGTAAAHRRHVRAKERPCEACRRADSRRKGRVPQ